MSPRLEPDPDVKNDQTGYEFLLASADHGITFAALALSEGHSLDNMIQNIAQATMVYENVFRLMPSVRMDEKSQEELNARIQQLRSTLMQLGWGAGQYRQLQP